MAMNDDYRLVLTGDSSSLEQSLKAIEMYMDALESKNIDAPLTNFLEKLKVIAKEVKSVQNIMDKQSDKSLISPKAMDEAISSTQNVTKNINDLKKALNDIQTDNITKGIAPDPEVEKVYSKLNKTLNNTQTELEKVASQKIGSDSDITNRIKEMKTLNQVTEEYNKLVKDASSAKEYTKQLRANRNMVRGHISRSEGSNRMSYDQGARVRSELGKVDTFEKQREANNRRIKENQDRYRGYRQQQQDLVGKRARGEISSEDYKKQSASIKMMIDESEKLSEVYRKTGAELDKSINYYKNSAKKQFAQREIEQQRGTMGKLFQDRLPSIGAHATMAVTALAGGMYMKGASLSEANRPMVTSLGQNSDNMDIDAVRNTYGDLSIDNKLGYNSTDMLKMATSYESSIGHKSDADTYKGAKQLAVGGRSLGIQDQEAYQQSMSQLMHTGGVNSDNMKAMQDAFLGGIRESDMVGRQDEQLKALSTIAEQSGQGRTLSKGEMSNLTSLQAQVAGTGSKGLQGAQGAQALSSIDQGIKNGMGNSYTRLAMGWGTKYQGLEGMHDLQAQMDKGISDPNNLVNIFDQANNIGSTTKEKQAIAKKGFESMGANLTQEQTDELYNLYASGKLSKEELASKAKSMEQEGSKAGDKNKDKYSESKAGRNDHNKAKTDDKAEDIYDLAQPIRDVHSAMASLPAPLYLASGAVLAFVASLAKSTAMMAGGSLLGKGQKGLKDWFNNRKGGSTGKTGGGKPGGNPNGGGRFGGLKNLADTILGDNPRGGDRPFKDQAKGAGQTAKGMGKTLFDTFGKRDFTFGEYMGRTKDLGKGAWNKGKGAFGKAKGKFSGKGSDLGFMSQAPTANAGGLGKLGGLTSKLGWIGAGLSAFDIGSSLIQGDTKEASSKFGNTIGSIIDPLNLGYGDGLRDYATKTAEGSMTSDGWKLWSNGDKDGKNKFQDSPVGKLWGGITDFFTPDNPSKLDETVKNKKGNIISYILIALLIEQSVSTEC
ncbi:tail lysin [Staphylococcus phage vB_SauM-HM01]|nr:tail lysin [Staphylococcus phage vB_SauM-HM01]